MVEPGLALIVYGVWVQGQGWLRDEKNSRALADPRYAVMETAAKLIGPTAAVMAIDESLVAIEAQLVRAEKARLDLDAARKDAKWWRHIPWPSWINLHS